ncbi:hypothetical protein, partial [Mycolicibacterium sp. D5.8-2]|uniref:hypothetical protein n=1 Tax=Mycolicibacterium sp. D5.8-2 TaxID=3085903 RepID=UPI00298C4147
ALSPWKPQASGLPVRNSSDLVLSQAVAAVECRPHGRGYPAVLSVRADGKVSIPVYLNRPRFDAAAV